MNGYDDQHNDHQDQQDHGACITDLCLRQTESKSTATLPPTPTWIYSKNLSFLTLMCIMIIIMVIMAIMFIISAISLTYTLKSKLCQKLWRALNAAAYAMHDMHKSLFRNSDFNPGLYSGLIDDMTFWKRKSKLPNYRKYHKIVDDGKLTRKNKKKKWMIWSSLSRWTRRKSGW